jgi:DNA-binding NarL/FixJ family response regulator
MTYRIVVVAGEYEALRALASQLGEGIEVSFIESANEALWEVRSNPPHVILAALDLTEMTGLEIAEILPNFDVPTRIVICSQQENPAAQREAKELGVTQFLSGTLSVEMLRSALDQAHQEYSIAVVQAEEDEEEDIEPEPEPEPEPKPKREPRPTPARSSAPPPERAAPASSRAPIARKSGRGTGGLSGRGGLAARAAAMEHRAPERSEPEHDFAHSHRRSAANMVLTSENLNPIRSIMSQLSQELGPQCILLTDRAGMVLVEVGTTDRLPVMILLPLLSTSFATSGEVARQLGEEDATTLYIHEGLNYDLYCFDIAQSFLLVLVFNKKVASSKIGAVWVNTKRAIRELQEALLN